MLQKISVVFVLFAAVMMNGGIFAQSSDAEAERERQERRLKREKEGQKRIETLFQANKPPKGTASVVGRSLVYSVDKGFGNTIALLESSKNKDLQKEIGLNQEQIDRLNVLHNELQVGMLVQAPKYVSRFKTMTDADHESIQKDIMAEMRKITERVDSVTTPEQKDNTRRLVFQATGGLDSPVVNLDAMSALKLSDTQTEQVRATFKELEKERLASLEAGLNLVEKYFELGGANMTPEQRAAFEEEAKSHEIRSAALGRKVGETLRKHLTDEQRELERTLLANRPGFLPRLPGAMRGNFSRPEVLPLNSWVPGQGTLKEQTEEKKSRRPFPTSDTK